MCMYSFIHLPGLPWLKSAPPSTHPCSSSLSRMGPRASSMLTALPFCVTSMAPLRTSLQMFERLPLVRNCKNCMRYRKARILNAIFVFVKSGEYAGYALLCDYASSGWLGHILSLPSLKWNVDNSVKDHKGACTYDVYIFIILSDSPDSLLESLPSSSSEDKSSLRLQGKRESRLRQFKINDFFHEKQMNN